MVSRRKDILPASLPRRPDKTAQIETEIAAISLLFLEIEIFYNSVNGRAANRLLPSSADDTCQWTTPRSAAGRWRCAPACAPCYRQPPAFFALAGCAHLRCLFPEKIALPPPEYVDPPPVA